MNPIFLTHIPKTAGTSIRKAVIAPHVAADQVLCPRGLVSLLRTSLSGNPPSFRFMRGHYPYGVHKFARFRGRPRYFVMLRDPIERALSYYHTKLRSSGDNLARAYADAHAYNLIEYYQHPRYQNMQARTVAGVLIHRMGAHVSINRIKPLVHRIAQRNLLHSYEAFGLTERFDESAQLFADKLGWTYQANEKRYKTVPDRPKKEDLTTSQIQTLLRLNAIDVALYKTACECFDEQIS